MKINPLNCIDFYKAGHKDQYPEGTEYVFSNFTPRSDKLAPVLREHFDGRIVFFGLQGFIKHFLIDTWNSEFFQKPKARAMSDYKRRMDGALGVDVVDISHIGELHDLGYMPVEIRALPEGTKVPMKVPVLTVVNTDTRFFWLSNYIETVLSSEVWKPCTVATIANEYRKLFTKYAKETGSPLDFVPVQGHDFSARGMSGIYDNASSGAGHLTSFIGTDSVVAIDYLENYYEGYREPVIGVSIPATEHSVMCMGTKEDEIGTYKRLITETYSSGNVGIVSDTWDLWEVLTNYTVELKDEILNRIPDKNGMAKVVFRPDSGDPVEILCGEQIEEYSKETCPTFEDFKEYVEDGLHDTLQETTPHGEHGGDISGLYRYDGQVYRCTYSPDWNRHDKQYYYMDNWGGDHLTVQKVELTPEQKGAVEILWEIFGGTETEEGYKVLHERVGLIYGDSITLQRGANIQRRLKDKGFASCNVVFGLGSFTYQYLTRDSFGFAMKATWGMVNGEEREIFKDPVTDDGTKKSARGLLRVVDDEYSGITLIDGLDLSGYTKLEDADLMQTVFLNGVEHNSQTLTDIRKRILES